MSRARRHATLTLPAIAFIAVAAWAVAHDGGRGAPPETGVAEAAAAPAPATRQGRRTTRTPAEGTRLYTRNASAVETPAAAAATRREIPITVRRRAPTVRGGAAPRSVQILQVPVPASLPAARNVDWTMRPHPRAEVLSGVAGTITASEPTNRRAITVVTRIPARAMAGVLQVGEADFRVDSEVVTVRVELVVDRIRRMSVTPTRPSMGALAGQRIRIPLEIRNTGNSVDTAVVVADLPAGWTRPEAQRVALSPGERRVVTVESRIPRGTGTSAFYPVFRVLVGDSVTSTTTMATQVEDRSDGPHAVGPVLTVGASTSTGDTIASSPALDFYLNGQITDRISVLGRADWAVDEDRLDRRALSRVGTYLGGAFLSVRGPGWYVMGGNTGATVSTLAGISAYGKGVSGGMNLGKTTVTGLLVNVPEGSGVQGGGRADYQLAHGTVGVAASHLTEATASGRGLDAVALIGTATPWSKVKLTGELGYRAFDGGSGAGVAFGAERTSRQGILGFNIQHSPGGSQAYGRALTDWSALAARQFSDRFALQGNIFSSLDRPPRAGGEYTSNGWSVVPRFAVTPNLIAEVQVRQNAFSSETGTAGGFDSRDRSSSAILRKVNGRLGWSVGGSLNSTERTTTFASGTDVTLKAQHYGVNAGASAVLPRGLFGIGTEFSRSGSGSGLAARQGRITFTAARLAPFTAPSAPLFRAEAEYTTWFGDQPAVMISRVGAEAALPGDINLRIDAEHNPLFRGARSATPWILAIRVERGFTLGWAARQATTRGSVFEDRNGNGVRDGSEGGLAGVMVRRGSESAVTDASGRFAFVGTDRIPAEVDPTSLPQGVVAPVVRSGVGGQVLELGVVPTGAIEVRLVPQADELGRRPESAPNTIAVLARDSRGAEWYLRADTAGVVRFDALPPDRYTFVADFAGTTERLRQVGDPVILDVRPGQNAPPLEVRYSIRAARLFNGGQGSTDQGRQRR